MNTNCPACIEKRIHSEQEWKNHPHAGHGYTREQGWTHPDLPGGVEPTEVILAAKLGEAKPS